MLRLFSGRSYSGSMKYPDQLDGSRTDLATLSLFAAASLVTVTLGASGIALSGAGMGSWMRNAAAWLVGLGLAAAIVAAGRSTRLCKGAILLAIGGLAATFFSPAQSGVHRWIDAGPLHVNMAALLLPMAIVGLALLRLSVAWFLAAVGLIGLLLVAQPDASQATAFLLAAGLLLLCSANAGTTRIAGMLGIAVLIIAAWLRPDPLKPVREVEEIFSLLADLSLPLAIIAAAALALTSLAPLRRARAGHGRTAEAAAALALYFVVVAIMPAAGAFPVPLVGLGMSFPVGYWLGMALLCARAQR